MYPSKIGNLDERQPWELQKAQVPGKDAWVEIIEGHIGTRR